jgi:hypothetical protein
LNSSNRSAQQQSLQRQHSDEDGHSSTSYQVDGYLDGIDGVDGLDDGEMISSALQRELSGSNVDEPLRTIFVSGFPCDVKYREIYNLFRFHDGFLHAVLNLKSRQPVAFATFKEQSQALACKNILFGIKTEDGDILLPAVEDFIEEVDNENKILYTNYPIELVELNKNL